MAKKVQRSRSTKVVPAMINDVNPKTFVDGDTYNVGATLANFLPNSVASAIFYQSEPRASFSNTTAASIVPSPQNPQQLLFLNSKFSYSGTTPTTAFLTVTVKTTAGTDVSKQVPVNYLPKRFLGK